MTTTKRIEMLKGPTGSEWRALAALRLAWRKAITAEERATDALPMNATAAQQKAVLLLVEASDRAARSLAVARGEIEKKMMYANLSKAARTAKLSEVARKAAATRAAKRAAMLVAA